MAFHDVITEEYIENMYNELSYIARDAKALAAIVGQLDHADRRFREAVLDGGLTLVDRDQFAANQTQTLDRLLSQTEAQVARLSGTVKRCRESLKLSGL